MDKSIVPFIKTSDAGTKDELLKEGFQLISYVDGMWTFLNESQKKESAAFKKNENLIYSNNLEF